MKLIQFFLFHIFQYVDKEHVLIYCNFAHFITIVRISVPHSVETGDHSPIQQ